MCMKYLSLDQVPIGISVCVININSDDRFSLRLKELGFNKGTQVTPLFRSAFNDPSAYMINGAVIALRSEESNKINVRFI